MAAVTALLNRLLGMAKQYQVRQVLMAIDKLEAQRD